ncbi:metallophosphoesterase [Antarcticibacterium flavum]|uniref:Metallophosphoesterase n=1 Tax=Antarcticibacterium flavum TaxID=2058175 RepID=A0A5B7X3S7_9FLAO|nr:MULTISPECIES: metallophosphoesterase [Antarcticibacterium]MCM4161855.1 phosphoesterase [Antarcticibacterium sp. W02-3]QCY70037.1 metallophosphoesterase [Antarcticibacterium flavum]
MRWIIFIVLYLLLNIYAFQAVRTLSKTYWAITPYILISLGILAFFLYEWNQPNPDGGFTGGRAYSLGLVLAIMAANLILTLFMFGEDIVRLLMAGYNKLFTTSGQFDLPSRRKFLSQVALGIAAIPFASLLYGMYQGKYNYKVLKYTLHFDDLPDAFDGYRITQISDIHSGSFDNKEKIEYAIDLINEQESDSVFFTGDLVNNLAAEMTPWTSTFSKIKARDGVYSVLGNHDYGDYVSWDSDREKLANLEAMKGVHSQMGWNLLLNEHKLVEKNGERIAFVGVENWGAGGFKKKGDLDKAGQGLTDKDFKVLLSHDPSYWQEKIKNDPKNYQLTLSGHTHGMQFGIEIPGWFKWSPVQYRYENWAGIYEEFGRYINVNRGFGYLAYPGRVGIWPEISVIELRKGPKPA